MCGLQVVDSRPLPWGLAWGRGGGDSLGVRGRSQLPGGYVHFRGLRQLGLTPGRPGHDLLCRNSFQRSSWDLKQGLPSSDLRSRDQSFRGRVGQMCGHSAREQEGERLCSSCENGAPAVCPKEGPVQSLRSRAQELQVVWRMGGQRQTCA